MRPMKIITIAAVSCSQLVAAQGTPRDGQLEAKREPTFAARPVQIKSTGRYIGTLAVPSGSDFQTNRENAAFERLDTVLTELRVANFRRIGSSRQVVFEAPDDSILNRIRSAKLFTTIVDDQLNYPHLISANSVIGTSVLHGAPAEGDGQTVVIIDTGVDSSHGFLSGRTVDGACFSSNYPPFGATSLCAGAATSAFGVAAGSNCTLTISGCNHGTHVAGIAAGAAGGSGVPANLTGLAPKARIIPIQVFSRFPYQPNSSLSLPYCNNAGGCAYAFDSDILAGLQHVNAQLSGQYPISSINMSLGGGQFTSNCDGSSPHTATIGLLRAKNIATVVSSGNNGFANAVGSPGCVSQAITIGATTDSDVVASFSNTSSQIDLLAPGVNINSSVPGGGYSNFNGTSMAAPIVTGAIASINSYHELPVATVEATLEATGVPVTSSVGTLPRINFATAMPSIQTNVPTGPFVWMRDTWNDFAQEPYGLFPAEVQYASPYIWIRSVQDGVANPHDHQDPEFGQPNYAYVKVHNTGSASGNGMLRLYYANATIGNLSDPNDWTLIQSAPMTLAAHSANIQEFTWSPPGAGHYCLLAFWVPTSGSTALPLNNNIGSAVLNERELIWRNVNVVNYQAPFYKSFLHTRIPAQPKMRLLVNVEEPTPGMKFETRQTDRLVLTAPKGVRVSRLVAANSKSGMIVDPRANTVSIPLRHGVYSLDFVSELKPGAKIAFGMTLPTTEGKAGKNLPKMKILISDISGDKLASEHPKQGVVYTVD